MKSDISKFEKITFGLNMGRTIDDINSFQFQLKKFVKIKNLKCPDNLFFVNDKLHQIFEDMLTDLDHLENSRKYMVNHLLL